MSSRIARFGTWSSPLPASAVAAGGLRLGAVQLDGDDVYWTEGRPTEGGRYALVRWRPDGTITDVVPPEINVRSRVHEYGGGAYAVRSGVVYCANFADQRVYRIAPGGEAAPLTPPGTRFYADFEIDERRQRLLCVREDHTDTAREPVNTLVSIPIGPFDGGRPAPANPGGVIASGYDFYSTPRLSPDGSTLAWLAWRHPAMPWDGTELWVADVDDSGALVQATQVAGSAHESIYQPGWGPDGTLYYVSDRDGWWKIYRSDRSGRSDRSDRSRSGRSDRSDRSSDPVVRNPPEGAEFGRPEWVFGTATWRCAGPSRLVVSYTRKGRWHLAAVDAGSGALTDVGAELQPHDWLAANPTHAVLVAGFDARPDAVVRVSLDNGAVETIRPASTVHVDPGYVSIAQPIEFPTDGGLTAHAFYYAPRNRDFSPPPDEKPPLIAISHGGPTSAAESMFDLEIQYWTSRGFALVDVNYGGSSGFGRLYRERLKGQWGVVDVRDVINAARFLVEAGQADPQRLIIRGGSAGGYTTLAALTFYPEVFRAGASYYGVSDLEVLEVDTHKFESRYSHGLVGPYPAMKDLYRQRSPIHAIDRLACPLILFQGLEDKIVPPNQSQMMADAVRSKGLPVAYLPFEGEQHGFRKADTIIRTLEAELYFYGKVFGFTPADPIEPVKIDNL